MNGTAPRRGGKERALARQHWLVKSEPEAFSIEDLERAPAHTTSWEGVRNYQARNFLREMEPGDGVLFYHSNASPTGVAGAAEVARAAYPDPTALDRRSPYFDPKATRADPRWSVVDLTWRATFREVISLDRLRQVPALARMILLRKGNRLSVMPVTPAEWKAVLGLAGSKG